MTAVTTTIIDASARTIREKDATIARLRRELYDRDVQQGAIECGMGSLTSQIAELRLQVAAEVLRCDVEAAHIDPIDLGAIVSIRSSDGIIRGVRIVRGQRPEVVPVRCWLCDDHGSHEGEDCACVAGRWEETR